MGVAFFQPDHETHISSRQYMEGQILKGLGGRAAEEIVFGEATSGALDDLEKATREAYMMVSFFGFNKKIGVVSFYDSTGQRDTGLTKPYSEETARLIDEEVRTLMGNLYEDVKILLQQNRPALDNVATLLLQKETIFKEDLEKILGKRSVENAALQT